jgi:hypothetical protein
VSSVLKAFGHREHGEGKASSDAPAGKYGDLRAATGGSGVKSAAVQKRKKKFLARCLPLRLCALLETPYRLRILWRRPIRPLAVGSLAATAKLAAHNAARRKLATGLLA